MENKTIFEWAEMFQEQIQNGASQSDIIQMLEEYGNQALRIHDVVGRSEQLAAIFNKMNSQHITMLEIGDYDKLAKEMISS